MKLRLEVSIGGRWPDDLSRLLSGLGNTAHIFDESRPNRSQLPRYASRGADMVRPCSSAGYTADRLGNDVLAVLDSLKLSEPVLWTSTLAKS